MRVVLVSQYFWPELFIINDLVKILTEQGHTVKVLTGKPNYPEGNIFEGYQAKGCEEEQFTAEIAVFRAPLRPRNKGRARDLILNYFSFVFNGLRYFPRAVKGESYDVVLAVGFSPITSAIPAILLKWRLKAHLAIWIQDLWPESLSATGFVKNPLLLGVVGWLVRGIYACSDTLLVQSQAFKKAIKRYAREDKIVYYPNSYRDIEEARVEATKVSQDLLDGLSRNFCLVFAGNLGTAQSLQTLVAVAEHLQTLSSFRLVIVGSGSMQDWLKQQKEEKKLSNLILAGRFPATEMPQFFKRAAGLIVSLNKDQIFSYTIPSKVQAYLAAGRPIIAALDGEGARVVREAGAGLTCAAEDVGGLVACIEELYSMSEAEREALGAAGREYFLQNFEMSSQAMRLIEILNDRLKVVTHG